MGQIAIKDDLLLQITAFATKRGIATEQQADELMREALVRRIGESGARAMMEMIAAMTPPDAKQTDSVELLRQDRTR